MSRPPSGSSNGKTSDKARTSATAKSAARTRRKTTSTRTTKAERERLRSRLPAQDERYADLWDRGAGKAHAAKAAAPLRVSVRSAHKKRLEKIEAQTRLDRQTILNRAIAAGWEALQMNGTTLDDAASKLRRQPSAAAGTVTLHPTAATLRILRKAEHPQAKSILLQTGLNVWKAA
ncbi:hypothetical protein [Rubrivirga sp.]|uniref:hypothetical protein n=1 Tax=Rubrivirga sp. TaxID=1885344 RepID=UPI003B52814A